MLKRSQVKAFTKSELSHLFSVSPSTLRRWVRLCAQRALSPFTMEQYKKVRILPPIWVLYIAEHLGYIDD